MITVLHFALKPNISQIHQINQVFLQPCWSRAKNITHNLFISFHGDNFVVLYTQIYNME